LAALGIGFSAFLGGVFASDWKPTDLESWAELAWWIGGICALVSVLFAALAVWPRIGNPPEEASVVYYWAHVARYKSLDELSRHLNENPVDHAERTCNQMWRISRIVKRKYEMIRRAMFLAGVAVCMFLISGLSLLYRTQ
jgi:MFS family permease